MSESDRLIEELQQLRRQLAAMPAVAAMQITVRALEDAGLCLVAPLQANYNDKANAFGGSLASLMTLAGWGWLSLQLRLAGLDADIYVADSQLRYLAPVYQDLCAVAAPAPGTDWNAFMQTLQQRGKARMQMQAQVVLAAGQPAATLTGRFVAIAKG
jgi:thioesterase domain-containing protein